MTGYLIRRLLLFVPTILGGSFLVVFLMSISPADPINDLVAQSEGLPPGVVEQRMAYIEERYGDLDTGPVEKWLRYVNKVSPVGLATWQYEDEPVVEQRRLRRAWQEQAEPEVREDVLADLSEELAAIEADESLTPGERAARQGELASGEVSERMDALEAAQGFDPLPGQVKSYIPWFKLPDFGDSVVKTRPVWPVIAEALPITLLLNVLQLPLALSIALVTGVWSAKHRGRWQDVGTGFVLLALYSIPLIWMGVMSIGFLANEQQYLGWFPSGGLHSVGADDMPFLPSFSGGFEPGYLLDMLWHLALPVILLAIGSFAYFSKLARTSVLEVLGSDHVRTARAKGLSPNAVLLRHGVRNSLIPIITFVSALIPYLITGAVVIEVIFGINGMGRLFIQSIQAGDTELVLGVTMMILVLKLVCYLLADVAYVLADPRVSYDNAA